MECEKTDLVIISVLIYSFAKKIVLIYKKMVSCKQWNVKKRDQHPFVTGMGMKFG